MHQKTLHNKTWNMHEENRVNLTQKQFFSMVKSLWHTACQYNINHIHWKPASAKPWQWLLNCIKACIILWHIETLWCMCRRINSDCNLFMASLYMQRKMLRRFELLLSLISQRLMGWNGEVKWKDQWGNRGRELLKRSNERGRQRLTPQRDAQTDSAHYPDRLSEEKDYKVRKLENVQKQKDTFFEGDEPCASGDEKETAGRVSLSSPTTYACPMSSQEEESESFFKLLGLQRELSSTMLLNTLMMQGKKKMIMKIRAEAITSRGRAE